MSPTARLPDPEREGEQTVDGTLRLRGGCIPCPVRHLLRFILPTHVPESTKNAPMLCAFIPSPCPPCPKASFPGCALTIGS